MCQIPYCGIQNCNLIGKKENTICIILALYSLTGNESSLIVLIRKHLPSYNRIYEIFDNSLTIMIQEVTFQEKIIMF